jgi:hypothetical protein
MTFDDDDGGWLSTPFQTFVGDQSQTDQGPLYMTNEIW